MVVAFALGRKDQLMKKIQTIIAPVATFALAMSLVACGGSNAGGAASTEGKAAAESAAQTEAATDAAAESGADATTETAQAADTATITINTEGSGQIAWGYEGEKVQFDKDFPFQSAVINDASGKKIVMAAKADKGSKFSKWTKDGKDFSTDNKVEVEVDGDAAYVAVFAAK